VSTDDFRAGHDFGVDHDFGAGHAREAEGNAQ
jgi:hypothetical protein